MATPEPPPHPFAPRFEFAFTVAIDLTPPVWLTPTSMGATRAAVWAAQGTFEGPRIRGKVIPMSGGDYPLVRPNGVIDFDARYLLQADDGTPIYLQSRGYRWAEGEAMERMNRNEPLEPHEYYMRVSPKFDVPEGPHDWLAKHIFVGVAEKIPKANRIHYFMLL
ncbi:MAG: hypothetical protein BGP16_10855 [Sphingobium sp. 66-54]|nr:MAG: hypothetical protein BGP16_10855 [Sphingobium sp. 66-54]